MSRATDRRPGSPPGRGICIMGRRAFGTGIGQLTDSLAELLARRYDVELWDLHDRRDTGNVELSSGRRVPLATELDGHAVYVFADVLWNGVGYHSYIAPPKTGLRIAYLAFDSDKLPAEWVSRLNADFDTVLFTSAHLIDVAVASGVQIEVGALPLALDVERHVARAYRPCARTVRFGTLSAYHPRKGLEVLVSSFLKEFEEQDDVELTLHSNLAIGDTARAVRAMVDSSGAGKVRLSTANLPGEEKEALLDTFDVYVNASAGEGYSVGPREALARGTVLVATDIGAHRQLFGPAGVFPVATSHDVPAIYPEIDGRRFGSQRHVDRGSMRASLRAAYEFARSQEAAATAGERKRRGARFGMQALERVYWRAVDPDAVALQRALPEHEHTVLPSGHRSLARASSGRHGARLGAERLVVQAHDAGFFSLFNIYLSHLAWSLHESPQRLVLPDWDAGRLLTRLDGVQPLSYCYSTPSQGNLWNHLFAPPYDLSPEELDREDLLYDNAVTPRHLWNEDKEPHLTYVNAYELYRRFDFDRIRRQYHSAIQEHVRLLPHHAAQIEQFRRDKAGGRFLVAAHVKHPSHAVEQPDGRMADRHAYVDLVRDAVRERGVKESSDDWAVFLATDQQRVVELFVEQFGDRVISFGDVERISVTTDDAFDVLEVEDQVADGHQLQHQIAADHSRWSPRLAWEVLRDAHAMASADVLFHAVSNVATAVGFLGPEVDMRFAAADS